MSTITTARRIDYGRPQPADVSTQSKCPARWGNLRNQPRSQRGMTAGDAGVTTPDGGRRHPPGVMRPEIACLVSSGRESGGRAHGRCRS